MKIPLPLVAPWALLLHAPRLAPRCGSLNCLEPGTVLRVVKDVAVKGCSAKGRLGVLIEDRSVPDEDEWGACCEPAWGEPQLTVRLMPEGPVGYYEYAELEHIGARGSSSDFVEGDRVRVVSDVPVKGIANSNGMCGTVVEAWEQCATDPACCCNELATVPLQVRLDGETASSSRSDDILGYFAADEVEVV